GEGSATTALERALENGEDEGLVWEAAKALVRLRAEHATPTLMRLLARSSPSKQAAAAMNPDLAVNVRAHATEALGVMQAHEAVPDLITTLSSESAELRYWAAYSLSQLGDPVSIPELERVARRWLV